MQTWRVMAAIVVSGGLLLLVLLMAAGAAEGPHLDTPTEQAPSPGAPLEEAWTPLALVGGTALLAGGAWIGTLERAGPPRGAR
jgi:hypothetical protein